MLFLNAINYQSAYILNIYDTAFPYYVNEVTGEFVPYYSGTVYFNNLPLDKVVDDPCIKEIVKAQMLVLHNIAYYIIRVYVC